MKNRYLIITIALAILAGAAAAQNYGDPTQAPASFDDLILAGITQGGTMDDISAREPGAEIVGITMEKKNDEIEILFKVHGAGEAEKAVRLSVYDQTGRELAVLVDDLLEPDTYQVIWYCRDSQGRPVPRGLYFARLAADGQAALQRLAAY